LPEIGSAPEGEDTRLHDHTLLRAHGRVIFVALWL